MCLARISDTPAHHQRNGRQAVDFILFCWNQNRCAKICFGRFSVVLHVRTIKNAVGMYEPRKRERTQPRFYRICLLLASFVCLFYQCDFRSALFNNFCCFVLFLRATNFFAVGFSYWLWFIYLWIIDVYIFIYLYICRFIGFCIVFSSLLLGSCTGHSVLFWRQTAITPMCGVFAKRLVSSRRGTSTTIAAVTLWNFIWQE